MSSAKDIQHISTTKVQPASYTSHKRIDLNPWDLKFLGMQYMQNGLVYTKQQSLVKKEEGTNGNATDDVITHLKTSLSYTLDHFFPLAGRLGAEKHEDDDTISFYINCNSEGAEFIHATAKISVDDILSPAYVPQSIIDPLLPLYGVVNYEGRSQPLLSVQVTELLDGIFIGCSTNHSVCDGTSFWKFINLWSAICRSPDNYTPDCAPVFERWFMKDTDCPLRLSSSLAGKFLAVRIRPSDTAIPPLHNCVEKCFGFTKTSIAKLKETANLEIASPTKENMLISSLQAVLAHVWLAVIRARRSLNINYNENEETFFGLAMSNRTKLIPPLPEGFFGNSTTAGSVILKDDEVLEKGLGFLASSLNAVVNSHCDEKIKSFMESWIKNPSIFSSDDVTKSFMESWIKSPSIFSSDDDVTGFGNKKLFARGSHRFDMYGNDFGWGRPIAVKTGTNGKFSGITTPNPGPVEGSIDIEIILPIEIFKAMESDSEFMEALST